VKRIGLGRNGLIDENAGDPLDGLVNLFDLGMVLAVAFLIAGLSLTIDVKSGKSRPRDPAARSARVLPSPPSSPSASGRGQPVGQVYRLADGRLIYVKGGARSR
jgi:hypothetical protein